MQRLVRPRVGFLRVDRTLATPLRAVLVTLGMLALVRLPSSQNEADVLGSVVIGAAEVTDLAPTDDFGRSIAFMDDLDGDGSPDLAVGAPCAAGGGVQRGSVFLVFTDGSGHFDGFLNLTGSALGVADNTFFGWSVANAGDLDGDGLSELAVGSHQDSGVMGSVWIVFLDKQDLANRVLTVNAFQRITRNDPVFSPGPTTCQQTIAGGDEFGYSVGGLGDLNGDQIPDIAVGAPGTHLVGCGNPNCPAGAVWILFLDADGTVQSVQLISPNPCGGWWTRFPPVPGSGPRWTACPTTTWTASRIRT